MPFQKIANAIQEDWRELRRRESKLESKQRKYEEMRESWRSVSDRLAPFVLNSYLSPISDHPSHRYILQLTVCAGKREETKRLLQRELGLEFIHPSKKHEGFFAVWNDDVRVYILEPL